MADVGRNEVHDCASGGMPHSGAEPQCTAQAKSAEAVGRCGELRGDVAEFWADVASPERAGLARAQLTNFTRLPLERIHNMLKMFVTNGSYNKTIAQLQVSPPPASLRAAACAAAPEPGSSIPRLGHELACSFVRSFVCLFVCLFVVCVPGFLEQVSGARQARVRGRNVPH